MRRDVRSCGSWWVKRATRAPLPFDRSQTRPRTGSRARRAIRLAWRGRAAGRQAGNRGQGWFWAEAARTGRISLGHSFHRLGPPWRPKDARVVAGSRRHAVDRRGGAAFAARWRSRAPHTSAGSRCPRAPLRWWHSSRPELASSPRRRPSPRLRLPGLRQGGR
jgi:hypothetical protein